MADEAEEMVVGKMTILSRRCIPADARLNEPGKCVSKQVSKQLSTTNAPGTRAAKYSMARAEARLAQLACSEAPDGRERWTLQMLADKLIELEVVEISRSVDGPTTLKKMNLRLG